MVQIHQAGPFDDLPDLLVPGKDVLPQQLWADHHTGRISQIVRHANRPDTVELDQNLNDLFLNHAYALDHLLGDSVTRGKRNAERLQTHQHPRGGEDVAHVDDRHGVIRQQFPQRLDSVVAEAIGLGPGKGFDRGLIANDPLTVLGPHPRITLFGERVVVALGRFEHTGFHLLRAHNAREFTAERLPQADR